MAPPFPLPSFPPASSSHPPSSDNPGSPFPSLVDATSLSSLLLPCIKIKTCPSSLESRQLPVRVSSSRPRLLYPRSRFAL